MTPVVVDASVAIKWFVRESDSEDAARLLAADVALHAPALLRLELVNGLWKHWRRKAITADDVDLSVASAERMVAFWHDDAPLTRMAAKLTIELDHPVYDCIYVALARRLTAPLVTADKRLLDVAPDVAASARDWFAR